jgi:hypothetical protein
VQGEIRNIPKKAFKSSLHSASRHFTSRRVKVRGLNA